VRFSRPNAPSLSDSAASVRKDFGYTNLMFGIRVLLFLLGIGLVVWILIRLAKGPALAKKPQKKVGDMVPCSHCGVYVPRGEALQDGDRYFCCREHRDADR
jgi:uncharacterized protein